MAERFAWGGKAGAAGWLLVAVLSLGGCAGQSLQSSPAQQKARRRASIHTELGAGYYTRGQPGVALQELKIAVQADPGYAPAYNMRGLVYMSLRENALAQRNFERALALAPNDSDAHNNYGWFLCRQNRVDESLKQFRAAVKNPLYATPEKAYINAGICALKKNEVAAARGFFHHALAARPGNPLALYHLAQLSYKLGNYPAASAYLVRLSKVAPAEPQSVWLALRTARKLGHKDEEANYAAQLKNNFPNSPQTRALLSGRYE